MSVGVLSYYIRCVVRRIVPHSFLVWYRRVRWKIESRTLEAARTRSVALYGRFDANQLYQDLASIGIRRGGVLLVHSSFGRLYNFVGTADEILTVLENLVGPEGTLMMPAHVTYSERGPFVFNARKSPANTGLLCELFRRQPGVKRSLHPTHSVCAKGPLAEKLLADHHKDSLHNCGPLSPYAKLIDYDGQILGLGLPSAYTTVLHVVEDLNLARYPRRTYLETPVEFTAIDEAGQRFTLNVLRRDPVIGSTLDLSRIARHLSERALCTFAIRGVPVFLANGRSLFEELQSLLDRGIILYA